MHDNLIRGAGAVYKLPRFYDVSFLPVNCTVKTVLLLQKQYITDSNPPRITETPNNSLKCHHWI